MAGPIAPPVLCLMGPTGSGKTSLAIWLAARFPVEVVSVDSALVYRGLDVGTAKPDPGQRRVVRHHLIDICDPAEAYSAARFRRDALAAIANIHAAGRIPLLVGGTGLYFRVLESGLAPLPEADPVLRARLAGELARAGSARLHARLATVDPQTAARLHPNDRHRILRALEVWALSGQPMSTLLAAGRAAPTLPFSPRKWVIAPADRRALHAALAARFAQMLERGFVNEVRALRERADLGLHRPALRAVGYRAIWRYLAGELSAPDMVHAAVTSTRQLAKRQYTWFRREADARWLDAYAPGTPDAIAAEIAGQQFRRIVEYT